MLSINGISGPSLGFHGLQVTQCPLFGGTQFFNNTRNRLSIKLTTDEGKELVFFIDPGDTEEFQLDGCYYLTVMHVVFIKSFVMLTSTGSHVGMMMVTEAISCNGHTAQLEVSTPIDDIELDLGFIFGELGS